MKYRSGIQYLIFLVSFCLLSSCATVTVQTIKEYPKKSQDCELQVFTTVEEIEKPYEEICILYSQTGSSLFSNKTFEQAIELTKPKACHCGADAILITYTEKVGMGLFSWGEGKAVVTGIRYQ